MASEVAALVTLLAIGAGRTPCEDPNTGFGTYYCPYRTYSEVFIPSSQLVEGYGGRPLICPPPALVKGGECSSPGSNKPFFFRYKDTEVTGDVRPLSASEYAERVGGRGARVLLTYPRQGPGGDLGVSVVIGH